MIMHLSMLSPRVREAGYPRETDSASFSLVGDFDIRILPWGREFDIATTCFGQKAVPRVRNLTLSRCPGVGNLTLALVKMPNSGGSEPHVQIFFKLCQKLHLIMLTKS